MAPVPPPTTPFQPGASPSPPLSPITAGLGGLILLGQGLLDLLRPREKTPEPLPWNDGASQTVTFNPPQTIRVNFGRVVTGSATDCNNGSSRSFTVGPVNNSQTFNRTSGVRVLNAGDQTRSGGCPGGFGISGAFGEVQFLDADGNPFWSSGPLFNGVIRSGSESGSLTLRMPVTIENLTTGQPVLRPGGAAPAAPPSVAPVPLPGLPEADEVQSPRPLLPTVPLPVPQTTPDGQPVPRPSPAPGGLPSTAPRPGTAPRPSTAPATRPNTPPTLPQASPITAGGVRPQLPPAPQITAPGTTFLPGGRPLPDNGPRPTPEAIAGELGKLEQKLEILLNPKEELSPLDLLNRIIDQTENIKFLIETLFPPEPYTFEPGAYQLSPICDRDAEGDLLPPRLAPWNGGQGEFTELRQRLDALAVLIQHHKDTKQPTCGGRGNGPHSNVTVHFESD